MEVSVVNAQNVPEGCFLSLSAGGSRRQAPLVPRQKFAFGNSASTAAVAAGGTGLKVDVLSVQGSARVTASDLMAGVAAGSGGATASDEGPGSILTVPFPWQHPRLPLPAEEAAGEPGSGAVGAAQGPMTVDLQVRAAPQAADGPQQPPWQMGKSPLRPGNCIADPAGAEFQLSAFPSPGVEQTLLRPPEFLKDADRPSSGASSAPGVPGQHRHQVALEARNYLEEHDILPFVERMLRQLIHDRPGNPWAAMAALLPGAAPLQGDIGALAWVTVLQFCMEELQNDQVLSSPELRLAVMKSVQEVLAGIPGVSTDLTEVEMGRHPAEGTVCTVTIYSPSADTAEGYKLAIDADGQGLSEALEKRILQRIHETAPSDGLGSTSLGLRSAPRVEVRQKLSLGLGLGLRKELALEGAGKDVAASTATTAAPSSNAGTTTFLGASGEPSSLGNSAMETTAWPASPINAGPEKETPALPPDTTVLEPLLQTTSAEETPAPLPDTKVLEPTVQTTSAEAKVLAEEPPPPLRTISAGEEQPDDASLVSSRASSVVAVALKIPAADPTDQAEIGRASLISSRQSSVVAVPLKILEADPTDQAAISRPSLPSRPDTAMTAITLTSGLSDSDVGWSSSEPEYLRRQARAVMLRAGQNGYLTTILDKAVAQQQEGEKLRVRARQSLMDSCLDGLLEARLDAAIEEHMPKVATSSPQLATSNAAVEEKGDLVMEQAPAAVLTKSLSEEAEASTQKREVAPAAAVQEASTQEIASAAVVREAASEEVETSKLEEPPEEVVPKAASAEAEASTQELAPAAVGPELASEDAEVSKQDDAPAAAVPEASKPEAEPAAVNPEAASEEAEASMQDEAPAAAVPEASKLEAEPAALNPEAASEEAEASKQDEAPAAAVPQSALEEAGASAPQDQPAEITEPPSVPTQAPEAAAPEEDGIAADAEAEPESALEALPEDTSKEEPSEAPNMRTAMLELPVEASEPNKADATLVEPLPLEGTTSEAPPALDPTESAAPADPGTIADTEHIRELEAALTTVVGPDVSLARMSTDEFREVRRAASIVAEHIELEQENAALQQELGDLLARATPNASPREERD